MVGAGAGAHIGSIERDIFYIGSCNRVVGSRRHGKKSTSIEQLQTTSKSPKTFEKKLGKGSFVNVSTTLSGACSPTAKAHESCCRCERTNECASLHHHADPPLLHTTHTTHDPYPSLPPDSPPSLLPTTPRSAVACSALSCCCSPPPLSLITTTAAALSPPPPPPPPPSTQHRSPAVATSIRRNFYQSSTTSLALIIPHRRTRHPHGSGSQPTPLQAFCIPLPTAAPLDRALRHPPSNPISWFDHAHPPPSYHRRPHHISRAASHTATLL